MERPVGRPLHVAVYEASDGEKPVTMTGSESTNRYDFGARDRSKREPDAREIGSESAKSFAKTTDGQSSKGRPPGDLCR